MEVKHVKDCEYYDVDYRIECEDEIKKITNKLISERKKNFNEHDNYNYDPGVNICPNVYCNIFSDLYNWYGFKNCLKMDTESLNTCFTDITNGGVGYYEKLIVLGAKILELFSELHFYNKYNIEKDEEIVKDLYNIKTIKDVVYHYLYVQKRKSRIIFKNSLYLFGYAYLYTPLFFNNKNSIIKYVKACIAYSVKFNKSNIFSWMPTLIEHIYHSQKLNVSDIDNENELIQDLQEYLGYPFDYIIPRIRECFSSHNLYMTNCHLTGLQIIRIFASEYFSHLAEDTGICGKEKALWVKEETDNFLNSNCIEIFSGTYMSINKYLNENNVKISKIRNIFEMIVSSCWIINDEKKNKIWVSALIQRLRQIQLLMQITTIEKWAYSIQKYNDININNFINDIYNFNNINGSILSPFQLQNINTYLPPNEQKLNSIPYYTTLADKYKERFGSKENDTPNKNKEVKFNVFNNISDKLSKHFQSRSRKPILALNMKQNHYPNTLNIQIDKKIKQPKETIIRNTKTNYESPDEEKNIKKSENENRRYEKTRHKHYNRSGIPVKIKYIKDVEDDENSKYIIEIPKKELKGKASKEHLKAVLWGNSRKGLEINIPSRKNKLPEMKIKQRN